MRCSSGFLSCQRSLLGSPLSLICSYGFLFSGLLFPLVQWESSLCLTDENSPREGMGWGRGRLSVVALSGNVLVWVCRGWMCSSASRLSHPPSSSWWKHKWRGLGKGMGLRSPNLDTQGQQWLTRKLLWLVQTLVRKRQSSQNILQATPANPPFPSTLSIALPPFPSHTRLPQADEII